MLIFLGAFAAVPLLLPWLVSRIGARAFYVAAALPALAFAHAIVAAPSVFGGDIPFEEYRWIRRSTCRCRCAWTCSDGSSRSS